MRILFDQRQPVPKRRFLDGHAVDKAYELMMTTDTNICYHQNQQHRSITILFLTTTSWPRIRQATEAIQVAVATNAGTAINVLTVTLGQAFT